MEDFLYLSIPVFHVQYKRWKKYGYVKAEEKENTKRALNRASGGYCMYCYSRIQVDNKLYGNLEHAIEKNNSEKLLECIPNIGMACPTCNQSFKRIGERKRKVSKLVRIKFEEKSKCTVKIRKQCTVPCKALRNLQISYSEMPGAEIILQPMGIFGKQSGEPLAIQYDIMKMEFRPNTIQYTYSNEEIIFINRHIQRFRLNDPKFRSHQLVAFMKNVIDAGGVLQQNEYSNLIVQLFADKLKEKTLKEKVDICSRIYTMIFLKL